MIRTKPFPSKNIPQKLLKSLREKADLSRISGWQQISVEDNELRAWCAKTAGIKFNQKSLDNMSIIFHRIYGNIPPHTDRGNISCKIIPLRFGKNTELVVRGNVYNAGKILKPYTVYTFNDHNEHALYNLSLIHI